MTAQRTLQLTRPIAFVDLETTGLDVEEDRIVEIAVVRLMPDGERQTRSRRLHPGRPIPPAATAIHGITDDDVADCPRFHQVAKTLHAALMECDLGGYNVEGFDLRMLAAEFRRVGLAFPPEGVRVVDPLRIFQRREGRDLASAVRFYCGRTLENAHSAEADTLATIDVLLGQLARYPDLPADVEGLHAESHARDPSFIDAGGRVRWREDGEAVLAFGKHRGTLLKELVARSRDYVEWMLRGEFPPDLKELLAAALRGDYPTRPAAAAPAEGA